MRDNKFTKINTYTIQYKFKTKRKLRTSIGTICLYPKQTD